MQKKFEYCLNSSRKGSTVVHLLWLTLFYYFQWSFCVEMSPVFTLTHWKDPPILYSICCGGQKRWRNLYLLFHIPPLSVPQVAMRQSLSNKDCIMICLVFWLKCLLSHIFLLHTSRSILSVHQVSSHAWEHLNPLTDLRTKTGRKLQKRTAASSAIYFSIFLPSDYALENYYTSQTMCRWKGSAYWMNIISHIYFYNLWIQ